MPKKNQPPLKPKKNMWKVVSIIFIIIFALIVFANLTRIIFFHPQLQKASDAQMQAAKLLATNDLVTRNEISTNYSIRVSSELRKPPIKDAVHTLEVSIFNESVRIVYIVDVDNNKILMYSKTEFYDQLNHTNPLDLRRERRIPLI